MLEIETFDEFADAAWLMMCISHAAGWQISSAPFPIQPKEGSITKNQPGLPPLNSSGVPEIETINGSDQTKRNHHTEIGGVQEAGTSAGAHLFPVIYHKRKALPIQRALRPIKKWVPSKLLPPKIDEQATMNLFAEEVSLERETGINSGFPYIHVLMPVMKPSYERWLDIVLIQDTWKTMSLWHDQVDTLRRSIEQSGIFRSVSYWKLDTYEEETGEGKKYTPALSPDAKNALSFRHSHLQLTNPSGRRLIVVISDCISPIWDNWEINSDHNGIGKILTDLGKRHPVAIAQMLPSQLWMYSGLRNLDLVEFFTRTAAAPNTDLDSKENIDSKQGLPLPVFTMSPETIFPWSMLISGRTSQPVRGVFIPYSGQGKPNIRFHQDFNGKQQELDKVNKFIRSVSMDTIRLAGYLAISHFDLELIQYMHRMLMPESSADVVAELILSGILQRQVRDENGEEKAYFHFVDDGSTREKLIHTIQPFDVLRAMATVYDRKPIFFTKENHTPVEFWDFIRNPAILQSVEKPSSLDQETLSYFQRALSSFGPRFSFVTAEIQKLLTGVREIRLAGNNNSPEEEIQNDPLLINPKAESRLSMSLEMPEKGFRVERSSKDFLEHSPINISMFGETGSGKTWLIKSFGRALFELANRENIALGFNLSTIDRFGNVHVDGMVRLPKDSPTTRMKDYLFLFKRYKKGKEYAPSDINYQEHLLCIHDFGGNDIFSFEPFVNVSYFYSDVIFLCLDAKKIEHGVSTRRYIRDAVLTLLTKLDSKAAKRYLLPVCITKTDELTAFPIDPWSFVGSYLGDDIVYILKGSGAGKNRFSQAFWTSSRGDIDKYNPGWTPKNLTLPLFWMLEQLEKKRSAFDFGYIQYPKE
ncbi:MAG: SAV_2336 N-terminal domain-related protein [Anaerolineales bacterium]